MALRSFREGDKVKAVVLSVDTERRRISFGLKPSYFADEDFQQQDESSEAEEPEPLGVVDEESDEGALEDSDDDPDEEEQDEGSDEEQEQEEDEDEDDMNVDVDIAAHGPIFGRQSEQTGVGSSLRNALNLGDGFQWSMGPNDDDVEMESSSEGEDEDGQTSKKKKRKHKEIEQDLTADLQTKVPESNADFERILLGSPNSSYLWMQYMSFQLQLSEIDKAREIAQRALKTISFREEQEKLNVWIALLNLENVYGTEESLETTFRDAARHNDSKTIYLRLAAIFDQSEKTEVSRTYFKGFCSLSRMSRKPKTNTSERARSLVKAQRSGRSLLSITFALESPKKRVPYYPAAFKVSRNGSVRTPSRLLTLD